MQNFGLSSEFTIFSRVSDIEVFLEGLCHPLGVFSEGAENAILVSAYLEFVQQRLFEINPRFAELISTLGKMRIFPKQQRLLEVPVLPANLSRKYAKRGTD